MESMTLETQERHLTEITLSQQVQDPALEARKRDILAEAEASGVKFLRLQFTDILGVIKNVEVPDRQFAAALDGKVMFDGSSIEGFVRIEESDMFLTPDLSTFGKALGNGFAVSALAGRRDLMERGGIRHEQERVFLLSTTHGAETHSLAAAVAVMGIHEKEDVPAQLRRLGQRLAAGVAQVTATAGVGDHLVTRGRPENLVFATLDQQLKPSQQYRTLFMRHLILGGVLGPSFVVSTALTDDDIDHTIDVVADASVVYRKALDDGDPTPWLEGRSIKPVFRTFA